MPTLRWRSPHPPPDEVVVMATELDAPDRRSLVALLRPVRAITRQLRRSDGLVRYQLSVDIRARRMTTMSAWISDDALDAFVVAEPHRSVMRAQRSRVTSTRFVRRRMPSSMKLDATSVLAIDRAGAGSAALTP